MADIVPIPKDARPFEEVVALPSNAKPYAPAGEVVPIPEDAMPLPSPELPARPGFFGGLTDIGQSIGRGAYDWRMGKAVEGFKLNLVDAPTTAKTIASLQKSQNEILPSQELAQAQEEMAAQTAEGPLGAAKAILTHPRASLAGFAQSVPSFVDTVVGGLTGAGAGALVGAPAGPVGMAVGAGIGAKAGLGAGSAVADYGSQLVQYLAEEGVDLTDEKAVEAAITDPELWRKVDQMAQRHAAVVGALDVVGAHVGGKIAEPVFAKTGELALRQKMTRLATAGGIDAIAGAAGEAGGEIAADPAAPLDWMSIEMEGFFGLATSTYEVGGPLLAQMRLRDRYGRSGGWTNVPLPGGVDPIAPSPGMVLEGRDVAAPVPFFSTEGPILPSVPEPTIPGEPFYSAVMRAVEGEKSETMKAGRWMNIIQKTADVKKAEIVDLGLPAFLADGNKQVSKADLLAHIAEQTINVELLDMTDYRPAYLLNGQHAEKWTSNHRLLGLTIPKEISGGLVDDNHFGVLAAPRNLLAHIRVGDMETIGGRALYVDEAQKGSIMETLAQPMAPKGQKAKQPWLSNMRLDGSREPAYVQADGTLSQGMWREQTDEEWKRNMDAAYDKALAEYRARGIDFPGFDRREEFEARVHQIRTELRGPPDVVFRGTKEQIEQQRKDWEAKHRERPYVPFSNDTWAEIAVKRLLRYAADNGYTKVVWSNEVLQQRRWNGRAPGRTYSEIIPAYLRKWAGRMGMGVYTMPVKAGIVSTTDVLAVDIPPEAATLVQRGLPLFSQPEETHMSASLGVPTGALADPVMVEKLKIVGKRIARVGQTLLQSMGVKAKVHFVIFDTLPDNARGSVERVGDSFIVRLAVRTPTGKDAGYRTPQEIYATAAHEIGHIVQQTALEAAPHDVKLAVNEALDRLIREKLNNGVVPKAFQFFTRRTNAVSSYGNIKRGATPPNSPSLTQDVSNLDVYWRSREEVFAEQVARWATTADKPLSLVDRFFSAVAKKVRHIVGVMYRRFGLGAVAPETVIANWLDSITDVSPYLQETMAVSQFLSRINNYRAMKKLGFAGSGRPQTSSTGGGRSVLGKLFGRDIPTGAKGAAAFADHYNWSYKFAMGLVQVANRNPRLAPLQIYKELQSQFTALATTVQARADETVRAWRNVGFKMAKNVGRMLDSYRRMEYLHPDEVAKNVVRMPMQSELNKLAIDNGVTGEGIKVFARVVEDYLWMLKQFRALAEAKAGGITDPIAQGLKLEAIQKAFGELESRPYVPIAHFGQYYVKVVDAKGTTVYMESVESRKAQDRLAARLGKGLKPGEQIVASIWPADAMSLRGLPPGVLALISENLELSETQRAVLGDLEFELGRGSGGIGGYRAASARTMTPGYSQDFSRSFAGFFFHGGTNLARLTFLDPMKEQIRAVGALVNQAPTVDQGVKLGHIRNYMAQHLNDVMDPKPDWWKLKAFTFFMAFGFNAAAAALNSTQVLVTSLPYLAADFGDLKAAGVILNTSRKLGTFHKKGKIETLAERGRDEFKAIDRAIKMGTLEEQFASDLAAMAQGRNLRSYVSDKADSLEAMFGRAASQPFALAEKFNRRLTFRAAWDLAVRNPASKAIDRAVEKHQLLFQQLRDEGESVGFARAFVYATEAVNYTQGIYLSYAKPKMFKGRLGSLFMFKSFLQQMVVNMWNKPGMGIRSVLVLGALGGMMGVPGAGDLEEWLKVAAHMMGKDYSLERDIREKVTELFGDEPLPNGMYPSELLLHGLSRYGFGGRHVLAATLGQLGVDLPFPVFDMSNSVGLGRLSPIDPSTLFSAEAALDPNKALALSAQQGIGAAYGFGLSLYKFLSDTHGLDDPDRWYRLMPRAAANAWRAADVAKQSYQAGGPAMYETAAHSPIADFDIRDPQDASELIAMGLGFPPLRVTATWDRIAAAREVKAYWVVQKEMLINQMDEMVIADDEVGIQTVAEAITKYNAGLPLEAIEIGKITGQGLRQTLKERAQARERRAQGLPATRPEAALNEKLGTMYPEAPAPRRVR